MRIEQIVAIETYKLDALIRLNFPLAYSEQGAPGIQNIAVVTECHRRAMKGRQMMAANVYYTHSPVGRLGKWKVQLADKSDS